MVLILCPCRHQRKFQEDVVKGNLAKASCGFVGAGRDVDVDMEALLVPVSYNADSVQLQS